MDQRPVAPHGDLAFGSMAFARPWFTAAPFAWASHIPFAFWLVELLQPRVTVELGTHIGNSYFALCQAMKTLELPGAMYAVDTWRGDEHAGLYDDTVYQRVFRINERQFAAFSRLLRCTFDEALPSFADGSVDLLHIDGLHTYEAVKHDFESWLPKVSPRGVVILHDTTVRDHGFGVWRLWAELSQRYPSVEFAHGHGLGVLLVGAGVSPGLRDLVARCASDERYLRDFLRFFENLGSLVLDACELQSVAESRAATTSAVRVAASVADGDRLAVFDALKAERDSLVAELQEVKSRSQELRTQLGVERMYSGQTRLALEKTESRESTLRGQLSQLGDRHNALTDWANNAWRMLTLARAGATWRVMRGLKRGSELLLKRRGAGVVDFSRWIGGKLVGKEVDLGHSFDPFDGLSAPPCGELEQAPVGAGEGGSVDAGLPTGMLLASPPTMRKEARPGTGPVDIVIPFKGAVHWVRSSVEALRAYTPSHLIRQIVLVDDGSSEDELRVVQTFVADLPDVALVSNGGPHGFAAACNLGASLSDGAYVLFLNSDCLVGAHTVEALLGAVTQDPSIGLACPIANRAGSVSVPMQPGFSYLELDRLLFEASKGLPPEEVIFEVCTVVGHCLLVSRLCLAATRGFDVSWGLGYGEETDLQMRARRLGFRGVVVTNTYVYHFAGGTFRYEDAHRELQRRNHARFLREWKDEYVALAAECARRDGILCATERLKKACASALTADVVFVLPGLPQAVGGILVATDLCNHLIRSGVRAIIVVLGEYRDQQFDEYPEALLTRPLHARDTAELLRMGGLRPSLVVATLFTTVQPSIELARARGAKFVNFVQGYEFFFENGRHYNDVRRSYEWSADFVVTSPWLAEGVLRHRPDANCYHLPIGVDRDVFMPSIRSTPSTKLRVAIVLRQSADKGQWIGADLVNLLERHSSAFALTIFSAPEYPLPLSPGSALNDETTQVALPIDRCRLAQIFQKCDVVIDTSLHEGFGLVPLEAMACGAAVIASDSGGVRQFLGHGENGFLVEGVNKPERFLERLLELQANRSLLRRMQQQALATAAAFEARACLDRYLALFRSLIRGETTAVSAYRYVAAGAATTNGDRHAVSS